MIIFSIFNSATKNSLRIGFTWIQFLEILLLGIIPVQYEFLTNLYRFPPPYIVLQESNLLMTKITFLSLIAIFIGAGILGTTGVTAISPAMAQTVIDNATIAGNMTGGNMTGGNMIMGGGNMTDDNMTEAAGQISGGGGRCGGTCYADSD